MDMHTDIRYVKGIGEKRAKQLQKLGIVDVESLLRHFPRAYQDRRPKPLCEIEDGEIAACILTVGTEPHMATLKRGLNLIKFNVFDGAYNCTVTFFNQPYVKDVFRRGAIYRFYGKFKKMGRSYALTSPIFDTVIPGKEEYLQDLYAVYPLTEGITQNVLRKAVGEVLSLAYSSGLLDFADTVSEKIREKYNIEPIKDAYYGIHSPKSEIELEAAKKAFIFEELYVFAAGVAISRQKRRKKDVLPFSDVDMKPFFDKLPFEFTSAQKRAFDEIYNDMVNGKHPMNRLLSGDVGSGKTAPAAAGAYVALKNGYAVCIMAPTEILARQHFLDLSPLFESLGYRCELLIGALSAAQKRKIKDEVASGEVRLIIGTHALLSDNFDVPNLGLVITDEQHRFGVDQRSQLQKKAEKCHSLIMSATPIPRTLALIMFGETEQSVIDKLPPSRQSVGTFLVDETYRERLNGFIRKQVNEGHQVYIVCPTIEENKSDEEEGRLLPMDKISMLDMPVRPLKAAVEYAKTLKEDVFPDINIEFLHGKMKSREKEEIMGRFVQGETKVLVSTTVIEVGVNVPNATLMIVENAEFFGLSQLHQLRGRVGRGNHKSYCVLVSDTQNEESRRRLDIMCKNHDGYAIAKEDLDLRGPGDFFKGQGDGVRQHGKLDFKMASMAHDVKLLSDAFAAANETIKDDPKLEAAENAILAQKIQDADFTA